jgi:hypothetical protein
MSSDLGVRTRQVVGDIVFVGPRSCPPQAGFGQAATLVGVAGQRDNLPSRLVGIAEGHQHSRRINQLFDASNSRTDQWHASQQSFLGDQRAGFPGGGQ